MKEYIQSVIVLIIFIAVIPCLAFVSDEKAEETSADVSIDTVKIYFRDKQKTEEYSLEEYMTGAVLAQMPADFDDEAIKAQAVLAKTYILRRKICEDKSPTNDLHGAIISDDTSLYQGFFTKEQAEKFYSSGKVKGYDFDKAYNKVKNDVKAVLDYTLTYNNEPVIVAFHAVSSGYTESAETAWGEKIPYLLAVKCDSDKKVDGMETKTVISADKLKEKLSSSFKDITFSGEVADYVKTEEKNVRGYVTKVNVCGKEITGREFAEALDISSPCFKTDYNDGNFTFTSYGCGHLVGMSQYGAESMAKDGRKFDEILKNFYIGCEVQRLTK